MNLCRPAPEYLDSYLRACKETFGHVHDSYIIHDPSKFDEWKNTIFQHYHDEESGTGLPDGYVPSATFWLIEENEYIGTLNIRLRLNDRLADYGGHIGLVLRMSKRGQGLASKICLLAIMKAKEMGIDPVLITCVESNVPSLHCLLKTDYVKMEKDTASVDGVIRPIRRFYY